MAMLACLVFVYVYCNSISKPPIGNFNATHAHVAMFGYGSHAFFGCGLTIKSMWGRADPRPLAVMCVIIAISARLNLQGKMCLLELIRIPLESQKEFE